MILLFIAGIVLLLVLSLPGALDLRSSPGSTPESTPAYEAPVLNPASDTPAQMSPQTPTQPSTQTTTQIPFANRTRTVFVTPGEPTEQITLMAPSESSPATPGATTFAYTRQSAPKTILDTAVADGRFTTFVTAVNAAGLNDMLGGTTMSGSETFTVFVPTDDAYRKLSAGSMNTLLKDPTADLLQILLYHVVSGKVMAADLKKLTSVETLQGGSMAISSANGVITVDGAQVIVTDIACTNGVIHVVDTVLLPPA